MKGPARMPPPVGGIVARREARRAWAVFFAGALLGLLIGALSALGSADFPYDAWRCALFCLALALLLSPRAVRFLWASWRGGYWRLLTSQKELSGTQRGFFLALSAALAVASVVFFQLWVAVALRAALQ